MFTTTPSALVVLAACSSAQVVLELATGSTLSLPCTALAHGNTTFTVSVPGRTVSASVWDDVDASSSSSSSLLFVDFAATYNAQAWTGVCAGRPECQAVVVLNCDAPSNAYFSWLAYVDARRVPVVVLTTASSASLRSNVANAERVTLSTAESEVATDVIASSASRALWCIPLLGEVALFTVSFSRLVHIVSTREAPAKVMAIMATQAAASLLQTSWMAPIVVCSFRCISYGAYLIVSSTVVPLSIAATTLLGLTLRDCSSWGQQRSLLWDRALPATLTVFLVAYQVFLFLQYAEQALLLAASVFGNASAVLLAVASGFFIRYGRRTVGILMESGAANASAMGFARRVVRCGCFGVLLIASDLALAACIDVSARFVVCWFAYLATVTCSVVMRFAEVAAFRVQDPVTNVVERVVSKAYRIGILPHNT
ncbi:Uncharacterized protein PBTT_09104 [Plasmodiophora brassicae]